MCHSRCAYFWICSVYSCVGVSLGEVLLMEVRKIRELCCFNSVHFSSVRNVASFGACLGPAKAVQTAHSLSSGPRQAASRGEQHNSSTTISEQAKRSARLGPSASSQVTTRRLHNQTAAVSVPLKIPWYKVRMFSWHGCVSDRLSIMTFSEIGPGPLKRNAFDRCLRLQLQKSRCSK